jgi:hypothetical protein
MPSPPLPPSSGGDTHTSYLAGSKLQQTKRLNNIITYANDNSIRTYDLEYQYYGIPKKSQLTSSATVDGGGAETPPQRRQPHGGDAYGVTDWAIFPIVRTT